MEFVELHYRDFDITLFRPSEVRQHRMWILTSV